ncbi:MAG TPA: hypothetical protein PLS56_02775 [Candidatus Dojkabacteria bacterium]|nr:hypothetical protein [Candidatus Dojkabacteria bacterium]
MDIFKQASKQKVRFQTSKGVLSVEQLWDLGLTDLDNLAVSLEAEHKESGKKSFLHASTAKDKTAKLKFDVVLDILTTKVDEEAAAKQAREDKEHNKKILELINEKKDESLKGKSVKQLEAMLR